MQLNYGALYIKGDHGDISIADCIPYIEEPQFSASENVPKTYNFKQQSASFEVSVNDLMLLEVAPEVPNKFTIEADVPIMIQARWHKKRRISKKWLKRYGMKPDVIKMQTDGVSGEYNPDSGEFSFETKKITYILKPHQKRKGIKIEY